MEYGEIEQLVGELETRLDRLRALYEQYFMGIERLEPLIPKKDVERRVQALRRVQIRNTALRFRFQMIVQRYNTFQSYWIRTCREIENGTYRRDRVGGRRAQTAKAEMDRELQKREDERKQKADDEARERELAGRFDLEEAAQEGLTGRKRSQPPVLARKGSRPPPADPEFDTKKTMPRLPAVTKDMEAAAKLRQLASSLRSDGDASPASDEPASGGVAGPSSGNGSRPRAVVPERAAAAREKAAHGGPTEERIRELYKTYVDAKRANKESTARLSYEVLERSVRETTERLAKKHKDRSIDFEIVVREGRTMIKPIVR